MLLSEQVLYPGCAGAKVREAGRRVLRDLLLDAQLTDGLDLHRRVAEAAAKLRVRPRSVTRLLARRTWLPMELRVCLPDGLQYGRPDPGVSLRRHHELRLVLLGPALVQDLINHLHDHGLVVDL